MRQRYLGWGLFFGGVSTVMIVCLLFYGYDEHQQQQAIKKEQNRLEELSQWRSRISENLGPKFAAGEFPNEANMSIRGPSAELNGELSTTLVRYSLTPSLQEEAEKLLKSYKPDYGAMVLMDALTGRVLVLASYEKNPSDLEHPTHWALRGTYPAASVFKIVTATAAVDKHQLGPDTIVMVNGGNHTLYRKNVLKTQVNRWTREMNMKEAFARSINTFFGRLAFERLAPQDIEEYAIRFGFNQLIRSDLPFDSGFTQVPSEKNFELAEIASGYNRITRMSPIQGAMIAASVAADGVMRVPSIVDDLRDKNGKILYQSEPVTAAVTMSSEGAKRLKVLMEATVHRGTSSTAFRPWTRNAKLKEIQVGGKTGSLYGDRPKGKTDWFVGYMISDTDRLAVAAVTVHKDKWTVKSAHLAQSLLQAHHRESLAAEGRAHASSASANAQGLRSKIVLGKLPQ